MKYQIKPSPLRDFFKRQSIVPFETVFAFFCVYSGAAGLASWGIVNDVFRQALGETLALSFNGAYLIAGLALYFGVGLNRRDIEAFGLIAIATSLIVRSIVIFNALEMSPTVVNSYVYAAAFIVACIVRMFSVARYRTLVETDSVEAIKPHPDD